MKVRELIALLSVQPEDAQVGMLWDGGVRSYVEACWLAQDGTVAVGPLDHPVYDDGDRIDGAPTSRADPYLNVYEMLGVECPKDDDDD